MNTQPDAIGPYRVIDQLGHGGMGRVYQAVHRETGKEYAVKTVRAPNPAQIEGIRREIRALARIRHPGVVHIVDEGVHEGIPWYAMEFLRGMSLRQYGAEYVWGTSSVSTAFIKDKIYQQIWYQDSPGSVQPMLKEIYGPTLTSEEIDQLKEQSSRESGSSGLEEKQTMVEAAAGQLSTVLTVSFRISKTLAYLHGQGIIHGDLKPDNILLRADGFPVIIDFGLVTHLFARETRETLEIEGIKGGTMVYLAPEVLAGEMVDARADLYSLGCMLFELVTGRPPVTGESLYELIRVKLESEPSRPSSFASHVPKELDRLIMKLLARRPRDRIAYADDVANLLVKLGADTSAVEELPKPAEYLYRSRFAGRDREIQMMEDCFDNLETGTGRLVMIGGESGIGKTRFMMKMMREAERRRIFTLSGECIPAGSSQEIGGTALFEPLHPIKRPLRTIAAYCHDRGIEETERIFGSHGKLLSVYEPVLSRLPGQERYEVPAVLPANAARLRLYTALSEVMSRFAEHQKVALFIDDLQWADDLTLGFFEFIQRIGQLSRSTLVLTGAYRIEEENDSIRRLRKDPRCLPLVLTKLDQEAVGTIISDMLALPKVSTPFTKFLTSFSEGNPFFITEYLRTAVLEEILFRDSNGFWQISTVSDQTATVRDYEDLPLPSALSELVKRRIGMLSEEAREVIRTASVLGKDFPALLLWNIVPFSETMFDTVDELIKRQIMFEPVPGEMRFAHDKIRETVYQGIDISERVALHRKAATAIQKLFRDSRQEYISSLAHHYELAGDKKLAREHHLEYARLTARQYSLGEAERSFLAYLDLTDRPDRESITVRIEYAEKVLLVQGRHAEVLKCYHRSAQEAHAGGMPEIEGRCHLGMAQMSKVMGDIQKALEYCRKAGEIFDRLNDAQGRSRAFSCHGDVLSNQGKLPEAKEALEKALSMQKELNDKDAIANTLFLLAPIYCMQGDHDAGLKLFEEALSIYRAAGDRQSEGGTLCNIANIHLYSGQTGQAKTIYEQAILLLREIGDMRNQGIVLGNLALIYFGNKELETAEQLFLQALEMHRKIQNRRMEGITLMKLGDVYVHRGRIEETHSNLKTALSILREVDDRQQTAVALRNLAELERVAHGNLDSAESILNESAAIFREIDFKYGIGTCASQAGLIALMRGQPCDDQIRLIQDLMVKTKSGIESDLGKALSALREAMLYMESGSTLFRGMIPEKIPEGLRDWLIRTGQLYG